MPQVDRIWWIPESKEAEEERTSLLSWAIGLITKGHTSLWRVCCRGFLVTSYCRHVYPSPMVLSIARETHTQERSWSLSKWDASLDISLWIQSTEQKHWPLNLLRLWKRKGTKRRRWAIGLIQSHRVSVLPPTANPLQKLQVALTWTSLPFS